MPITFEYRCFICGKNKDIELFVMPRSRKHAICKICAGDVNVVKVNGKKIVLKHKINKKKTFKGIILVPRIDK
jgi:hypothetical protein